MFNKTEERNIRLEYIYSNKYLQGYKCYVAAQKGYALPTVKFAFFKSG